MGFYVEAPVARGKTEWLIRFAGAEEVTAGHRCRVDQVTVCVVRNPGSFDAALIVLTDADREAALFEDGRPRRWLVMDKNRALTMVAPYKRETLAQELVRLARG